MRIKGTTSCNEIRNNIDHVSFELDRFITKVFDINFLVVTHTTTNPDNKKFVENCVHALNSRPNTVSTIFNSTPSYVGEVTLVADVRPYKVIEIPRHNS